MLVLSLQPLHRLCLCILSSSTKGGLRPRTQQEQAEEADLHRGWWPSVRLQNKEEEQEQVLVLVRLWALMMLQQVQRRPSREDEQLVLQPGRLRLQQQHPL